jgi:hypothetical protein
MGDDAESPCSRRAVSATAEVTRSADMRRRFEEITELLAASISSVEI